MRLFLPVKYFGDNNKKASAGISPSADIIDKYYNHVEKEFKGGYFPLGKNTTWHGGIHIHSPQGETIYAMTDGLIVAARLGGESTNLKHYGSNNFILIRHSYRTNIFYSLYQHLNFEALDTNNKKLSEFAWLYRNGRIDTKLLERFGTGNVCKVDKPVIAGDPLWTVGLYGSKTPIKDWRAPMFHWGIFSGDLVPGYTVTREDTDDNVNCDNTAISIILGPIIDKNRDRNWSDSEIVSFYSDTSKCREVRQYACKFINENAVDWDIACKQIRSLLFKKASPENIKPFNFWDEAKSAGVPLPADKKVWHYNPINFIEQAKGWDKELKEFAIKLWFVQIGGLDQVGQLEYPIKTSFGKWSNDNWLAIGKSTDTVLKAEERWQELMDLTDIVRIDSKNGTSQAIAVDILNRDKFNLLILREAAILIEKYKYLRVLFPHISANHPLYNKTFKPSFQYLIYNAGGNLYPLLLSGMVWACLGNSFKTFKALLEGSPLKNTIDNLKPRIKSIDELQFLETANDNSNLVRDWLLNDNNIDVITDFLENCDNTIWTRWNEHRGNVSRFMLLKEYYKKVFK